MPTHHQDDYKFQLFAVYTTGKLDLYLAWHRQKRPFDQEDLQEELLNKLNEIEGISLPPEAMLRQPKIILADFTDEKRLAKLLSVHEWMIEQVKQIA